MNPMPIALLLAVVALAGCGGGAAVMPSSAPVCVWHLLEPSDTADSLQAPGVSSCSADAFQLADASVSLVVGRDGDIASGSCSARVAQVGGDATYWFAELDACGARGFVTVDLPVR